MKKTVMTILIALLLENCILQLEGETSNEIGGECSIAPENIRLRIGVLADIHITSPEQQPVFEKTLRTLDAWGADGVMVCGDLADHGLLQQLELVAESWFRVFPGGKGQDGRPVANLMHYGDHDMCVAFSDHPAARKAFPDDAARRAGALRTMGAGVAWKHCFHEDWQPIQLKYVKGYAFVLCHFTSGQRGNLAGNNTPGLDEFFRTHSFDSSKPFFVSQHRPPKDTICGPQVVAAHNEDDGKSTTVYSRYPNLIAFFGHLHGSATCERNIWQGDFSCIHVPSLRYACTRGGRENGYNPADRPLYAPAVPEKIMPEHPSGLTHQGLFMTVSDTDVVFRRWDFEQDCSLGSDWIVPISSFACSADMRPYSPVRRSRELPVPEFQTNADVRVENIRKTDRAGNVRLMRVVSFPAVGASIGSVRANDYEVTVELQQDDVVRILCQKRVFSPRYLYGAICETERVECWFSQEEVPNGWVVRYVVRPVNAFGNKGCAIRTAFAKCLAD